MEFTTKIESNKNSEGGVINFRVTITDTTGIKASVFTSTFSDANIKPSEAWAIEDINLIKDQVLRSTNIQNVLRNNIALSIGSLGSL